MGLFTYKEYKEKKSTLEFHIDVEDITEDEFFRLKEWIKENIPSTERFTPTWNPDEDDIGSILTNIQNTQNIQSPPPVMSVNTMKKIRFRFKHEEHAMAFKLVI